MQALERAAAVFCTACICAELAARFVGPGWGQKCIKAVAGLYILVAFADALPGAKAQLTAPRRRLLWWAVWRMPSLRRRKKSFPDDWRMPVSARQASG